MIDFEQAKKLVADLERDLAKVESGSKDVQALRDEVETLRAVLDSPRPRHGWVEDALGSIHKHFVEAEEAALARTLDVSQYLAAIGRMLGM